MYSDLLFSLEYANDVLIPTCLKSGTTNDCKTNPFFPLSEFPSVVDVCDDEDDDKME